MMKNKREPLNEFKDLFFNRPTVMYINTQSSFFLFFTYFFFMLASPFFYCSVFFLFCCRSIASQLKSKAHNTVNSVCIWEMMMSQRTHPWAHRHYYMICAFYVCRLNNRLSNSAKEKFFCEGKINSHFIIYRLKSLRKKLQHEEV